MILTGFQIKKFRGITDSGWVDVLPLTVLVGKNESGKTALLKGLHKFNPFTPEPYIIDREWPRGDRRGRSDSHVVCTCRFTLTDTEKQDLAALTNQTMSLGSVDVTRDYAGRFEVLFPKEVFPNSLHPNDIDKICSSLPKPTEPIGDSFRAESQKCAEEVVRLAKEGRFTEFEALHSAHLEALKRNYTPGNPNPQHHNEAQHINNYSAIFQQIAANLKQAPSMQQKAHEYVVKRLPTFIYMSDYRTFTGSAMLDEVKKRKDKKASTEEDKTLLTILTLSGLDLDDLCKKAGEADREQRQYDLDDGSRTLTRDIENRWKQRKYEVQFRADGHHFFTMVQDDPKAARPGQPAGLIRLEERSKGFQWFFSFDLLLMHETRGTFKDCLMLLDEPGLHLHPEGQRDLLDRLEEYAKGNTLLYSTHLPFMIDLRKPERIRIISETEKGSIVTEDLTQTQPEAKLTLQAALGMSGRTSYLLAQRNLVVEGVDDEWILSALSNLLLRSGMAGIPEDVFITAAGGASEAAYIATLMIGQKLDVVVLLDSDKAGDDARDKLVKKWLTKYKGNTAAVISLGASVGTGTRDFSIEDLFPDDYYLDKVRKIYKKELAAAGDPKLELKGDDAICKRVERALADNKISFNKGSVAKAIRKELSQMKSVDDLPPGTKEKAAKLVASILVHFPELGQ